MTEKLRTCQKCPHAKRADLPMMGVIMVCEKTGYVVPGRSEGKAQTMEFYRVPEACPRPSSEVIKSAKPVAHKFREVVDVSEWPRINISPPNASAQGRASARPVERTVGRKPLED